MASAVYCAPIFADLNKWGRQDWDQFSFRSETPRLALLRDHVLPTWNPYADGGTVLLAHPHSPVLSPWYLIVLLLGTPLGLRVQVVVFMALGTVGMAAFLGRLGATRAGGIVGGIVFMMSSHFTLHLSEGHVEWCVLGLMPWLAWYMLRLDDGLRVIIAAAVLLASVVTFGVVYIPAVYMLFLSVWAVCEAIRARSFSPAARWAAVVVLAAALSSVKLLPTAEFVQRYPRPATLAAQDSSRLFLLAGFLDPRQARLHENYLVNRDRIEEAAVKGTLPAVDARMANASYLERLSLGFSIHEYACYAGVVGILLAVTGWIATWRRLWPLHTAGALAGITVLGSVSPIDLGAALGHLPFYGQLNVPSRFLAAVVFVLAVSAGFGASVVLEYVSGSRRAWRLPVAIVLVALVYGELTAMGWRILGNVFVAPPVVVDRYPDFAQRRATNPRPGRPRTALSGSMYARLLSNSGTTDAYENLSVAHGHVLLTDDPGYRGETYLQSGRGTVEVVKWTMSSVRVRIEPAGPDELVLNQNFDSGWGVRRRDANGSVTVAAARRSGDGLISLSVDGGPQEIEFYYLPRSFVVGAVVSGGTLALCIAAFWIAGKRGRHAPPATPSA